MTEVILYLLTGAAAGLSAGLLGIGGGLIIVPILFFIFSPHFSPGSREQAQDSYSKAPLWSEKRSHSYGLSEEQAYGHEDQPEP